MSSPARPPSSASKPVNLALPALVTTPQNEVVGMPLTITVQAAEPGIGAERGKRDVEPAFEQRALVADLVAVDLFGREAEERADFRILADAVAVEIGGVGPGPARVEAAALEALRIARVEVVVGRRLEA